jgi:light-regulated signal transduction histidine kinase (bacteriophytochrome)
VATPSQQTNQILELLRRLQVETAPAFWSELSELAEKRLAGQRQNRQEFESKAQVRGEVFLEQARGRIENVQRGFDQYAECLSQVQAAARKNQVEALEALAGRLEHVTQQLFEDLDAYAAFYFSWGENQSPLVTMIRHAVESYSRSALQSTQAQRILQDMQEHLSHQSDPVPPKEEQSKEGEP